MTKVVVELGLENDQEGNTWFSTGNHDEDSDVNLHMSRSMYVAMGSPANILVVIEGTKSGS